MTKTYRIQTWGLRPLASCIEIEADKPEEAVSRARQSETDLIAAAQDSENWVWDEFAVYNQGGTKLLHVRDWDARLRHAAPTMLEALQVISQGTNKGGKLSREGMQRIAEKAIAETSMPFSFGPRADTAVPARPTPLLVPPGIALAPGKLYLRLAHGRTDPDQEMEDQGFDGPTFGPLSRYYHTYCSTFRIDAESGSEELWLDVHDDTIEWDGCFYGELEVFVAGPNETA